MEIFASLSYFWGFISFFGVNIEFYTFLFPDDFHLNQNTKYKTKQSKQYVFMWILIYDKDMHNYIRQEYVYMYNWFLWMGYGSQTYMERMVDRKLWINNEHTMLKGSLLSYINSWHHKTFVIRRKFLQNIININAF